MLHAPTERASLVVTLGLVSPCFAQSVDVEQIEIEVDVSRDDGVLVPQPYEISFDATGTGISGGSVQTPSGDVVSLFFDEGEWSGSRGPYVSLAAMQADLGFGDFVFTLTAAGGGTVAAAVPYDPGTTDPFPGWGDPISPADGASGVAHDPILDWNCVGGPCGNFAWYVEVYPTTESGPSYGASLLTPNVTQWVPGCLAGNTEHGVYLASGAVLDGGPKLLSTISGGDDFIYFGGFEVVNETTFTTAPPSTAASLAVRLGSPPNPFALLPHFETKPVPGETWPSSVVHASFMPGALIDVLFVSQLPANFALPPYGTVLADPGSILLTLTRPPGGTFLVPIPPDCAFVGATLTLQAASSDGLLIALTNAVDGTIGTH